MSTTVRAVVLSIALLLGSGYAWPQLFKQSSDLMSLFVTSLIGVGFVFILCWLLPKSELLGRLPMHRVGFVRLILISVPVACLQVALGLLYWVYIDGPRLDAGPFHAIPVLLFALWTLADSGIRGVSEEAVFRGLLQPFLIQRYEKYVGGLYIAIAITTCWFLFAHLYGVPDLRFLPYLGFLSICCGYLAAKSGHFASSAVLHTTHNIGAAFLAYLEPFQLYAMLDRMLAKAGVFENLLLLGLIVANVWAVGILGRKWVASSGERRVPATC